MTQRNKSSRKKQVVGGNQSRELSGLWKGGFGGDGEITSHICGYHTEHCPGTRSSEAFKSIQALPGVTRSEVVGRLSQFHQNEIQVLYAYGKMHFVDY